MSTAWPVQRLGAVATVSAGNSAPQDKSLFAGGTHTFIRTSDVGQIRVGEIRDSADKLNDLGICGMRKFREGVTLVPKSGASTFNNHRVITAVEATVSSHLAVVDAHHGVLDDRYVFYFLQTVRAQDLIGDQSYPSLNLTHLESVEIPVPPLAEQQRIVAKLEMLLPEVEHGLSLVSRTKSKSDDLVLSALSEVFERLESAPPRLYSDVAELSLGKMLDRKKATGKNPTPYLRNVNVRWGAFDTSELMEMDITPSELDRVSVRQGDVVVCEGGEPGRCAVWREERSMAIQKALHRMRPKPGMDSDYLALNLEYQIKCGTAKELFTGTTIKHLTGEKLQVMTLPVPPLREQQEVVAQLNVVRQGADALRSVADERRRTLLALRQSVLAAAFRGDL